MRFLKNKTFQRGMKEYHLDDAYIYDVLSDVLATGRTISLGAKMYKIRSAKQGKGKRGGFRNIFFWKKGKLLIFCVLFGKNDQDNLSSDEKKALKILSKEYDSLTEEEINVLIKCNQFKRVDYDK